MGSLASTVTEFTPVVDIDPAVNVQIHLPSNTVKQTPESAVPDPVNAPQNNLSGGSIDPLLLIGGGLVAWFFWKGK